MTGAETKKPEFTISGTIETYRQIFNKKLDPIQALMTRKVDAPGQYDEDYEVGQGDA